MTDLPYYRITNCTVEVSEINSTIVIRILIKSKRMRWAEYIPRMGEMRNVYNLLVGKPERKNKE